MTSLNTGSAQTAATPTRTAPPIASDSATVVDPAAARATMVSRLEAEGALSLGAVRAALLSLPLEELIPQAYVRRSPDGETPKRWELLDWSAPQDRPELQGLLYDGGSVPVQHDGEQLLGRARGVRSGASITSMSTLMSLTAMLLEELDLRPGQRVLDVGTGAGVTAAVACRVCGDTGVVTLDRDQHLTDAAAVRLAALGLRPTVMCGSGQAGCPGLTFDRIFVSYAVSKVPAALVEQLAAGGRLLAHVTSASPSWPALAVVERDQGGRLRAELRAVESGHRAGHGMDRIYLAEEFRTRISTGQGDWTQRSKLAPPADTDRGLWLAVDHLLGGTLVRDFTAEHLAVGAPGCGSWLRVEPVSARRWNVITAGPRDLWKEIQDVTDRWRAAGCPDRYPLSFNADGTQRASSPCGRLSWPLPASRPADRSAST
ncbi:protein-L-isoaspartate O-methyltransferase [Streptomyces sp. NPDC091280]|uniref:protein-L-isoaspartate O-methyltransferase family protein n=1 Tax=Streptomyces sp. NPDC091280 TaxID=3365984 RepID=UPI003808847F